MAPKKKSQSLAEKIGNIVTDVPKTFTSDDEAEETKAKVVDYEDEISDSDDFEAKFNSSSIRKRNVGLLADVDRRYSAKKVNKKEIFNQDESSEEIDEDDDDSSNDEDGEAVGDSGSEDEENGELDSSEEDEKEKDDDDEDEESDENVSYKMFKKNVGDDSNNDDDESGSGDDDDDDLDDSVDMSNPLRRDRGPMEGGITTVSDTNVRAEIEKGNCVRKQLQLWENLLEMRIQMQKCLFNSNKMPQYDVYKDFNANKEFKKNSSDVKNELSKLLNGLLELQGKLLNEFPETKGILSGSTKNKADKEKSMSEKECDTMDEEIPSDSDDETNGNENENKLKNRDDSIDEEIPSDEEDEMNGNEEEDDEEDTDNEETKGPPKKKIKLHEFEQIIAKNHKSYAPYRNSVIQKWNDKVRVASGIIKKGPNQPALRQIEFALTSKDKLIKKAQLKRSEYEIIGKTAGALEENDGRRLQEYDTEIYDDDDFYHQLLRELIEYKSADITDPIQLSKQWIQLQNMRKKMKRKIDTRATKGRRLRYDVHQKLVNLMAPMAVYDTWTDHAKDELYSSLFGKTKSVAQEKKETL